MKISKHNLEKLGFFQLPQAESEFGTWYKTFDYLGILVVFDRTLGSLVRVDLTDDAGIQSFLQGDIVVRLEYDKMYLLDYKDMYHIDAFDLCSTINVWQIVTFAQLNRVVSILEKYVEYQVQKGWFEFWYGDRVLYDTGKGTSIGSIVSVDLKTDELSVLLSSGDTVKTSKSKLVKCPVSSLRKLTVSVKKMNQ